MYRFLQNLDDPSTTELRKKIIRQNHFLEKIYKEWYSLHLQALPKGRNPVLEIGAGGGFFSEVLPGTIKSDILYLSDLDVVLNGCGGLPFKDSSLRGIVMVNVLHHLSNPRMFFREAMRCLNDGGIISLIEPWRSDLSEIIYTRLHHEPFRPNDPTWEFKSGGPLTSANGALPYIIFQRDKDLFLKEFKQFRIEKVVPFMPFRYFLSGGLSYKNFVPAKSFLFFKAFEHLFQRSMNRIAAFAHIVLSKIEHPA